MAKKKVVVGDDGLPKLPVAQMLLLSPTEAVPYAKTQLEGHAQPGVLPDDTIARLIKMYREGSSVLDIAKGLGIGDNTVKRWLYRCEEVHILRVRRKTDSKAEEFEGQRLETEKKLLAKQEASVDADLLLAEEIRGKIQMMMGAITPEKIECSKLKDLVDSMAKLIEKHRLLTNKSTSNATTQSVVQYITQLNSMSMADRIKMAEARIVRRSVPAPDDQPLLEQDDPDEVN